MLSGFAQDVRASVRGIRRTPAPAAVIVLTVAISMAASALVFSIYEGVILRPFPYAEPAELVDVHLVNPVMVELDDPVNREHGASFPLSYPVFEAWRGDAGLPFTAFGAYQGGSAPMTLDGDTETEPLQVNWATAGVFEVLGVLPALGRLPAVEEDVPGGPATAVLSHRAWRTRFGGERSVLGRDVRLGEDTYRVVAVMPPDFYFPTPDVDVTVSFSDARRSSSAGAYFLRAIGRLAPGMEVGAAQQAMEGVVARAGTRIGRSDAGVRVVDRRSALLGDVDRALHVLMATVLVVLLVAVVNVANLLLARSVGRSGDAALRRALGAGAGRLVRLQLVESLLLVGAGALLGAAAAAGLLDPALRLLPETLPRQEEIAFNGTVAAFAALATLTAAVLTAVLPALLASRANPEAALRVAGRGVRHDRSAGRAQRALVVLEVTAAVVLLVGAGLLLRSYQRLTSVPLGFDPRDVAVVPLYTSPSFAQDREAIGAWEAAVRERVAAIPGVAEVLVSAEVPYSGGSGFLTIVHELPGGGTQPAPVPWSRVPPDYFHFLDAPLVEGRSFTQEDALRPDGGVVVSRRLATQLWGNAPAVGKRIRQEGDGAPWREVVGVVEGIRGEDPAEPPGAMLYEAGAPYGIAYVVARTSVPPAQVVAELEEVVLASRADLQAGARFTIEGKLAAATAHPRFRTTLLGTLAAVAGLLALMGIYAVISHAVAQRRHEIGICMALGANHRRVLAGVLAEGAFLAAVGTVLGILLAMSAAGAVRGFLFEVEPTDPMALGGVAVLVLTVALLAAWVPARRASAVPPAECLRGD